MTAFAPVFLAAHHDRLASRNTDRTNAEAVINPPGKSHHTPESREYFVLWAVAALGYAELMAVLIQTLFGRAVAVFLTGFLIAASAAHCTLPMSVPAPKLVAAPFDPCHEKPARTNECAQITCKSFTAQAAAANCGTENPLFESFTSFPEHHSGRLVRPPLPPPRNSMI